MSDEAVPPSYKPSAVPIAVCTLVDSALAPQKMLVVTIVLSAAVR